MSANANVVFLAALNGQSFLAANGALNLGGNCYTYLAGTLTASNTYTNSTGGTLNPNPIPVNVDGFLSNEIWIPDGTTLRVRIVDGANNLQDVDQIPGVNDLSNIVQYTFSGYLNSNTGGVVTFAIPQTAAESAAGVIPTNYTYPELNVLRYGADPTGTTSSDAAIAAALAVACPIVGGNEARYVYFPSGQYLINTTINATNSRLTNTRDVDGLVIYGDGVGATKLLGNTGNGFPIIETTGSQWLTLRDLTLSNPSGGTANSTIGIFQGVASTNPGNEQTQNQLYQRINIFLADNAGGNGGVGSVGIWNFGSEETTYDTVYIQSNCCWLASGENPPSSVTSFTPNSYQTLMSSHSCGVNTWIGECFLASLNSRSAPVITQDVNSVKMVNMYISNITTTNNNITAWTVYGQLGGCDFNGTVEQLPVMFTVFGTIQNTHARVTFGNLISANARLQLVTGGQGTITASKFSFLDNGTVARPLMGLIGSFVPATAVTSYIQNSEFFVNACDKQYLTIQENVLWNPSTGNILIRGVHANTLPYQFEVDGVGKQKVAVPLTTCLANGVSSNAEVVRMNMPSITVDNQNSLSAEMKLRGILTITGSGTNAKSTKYFEAVLGIAVAANGAIFFSNNGAADLTAIGSTANVSSAGNAITGVSVLGINNTTYVSMNVAPTRTGTNDENVQFIGEAELHWSGNESRAPSLQTLS